MTEEEVNGRVPKELGLMLNYLLCHFYDHSGISSAFCKSDPGEGNEASGTVSSDEEKRGTAEKLEASMDTYRNTAAYLKNNPLVIVKVIGITFIQRMALFAVTWFVYQAFGLHGTGFWDILFLQAVISVSVDMLPLPGGMGISETLFLTIFSPVFGGLLLPGMVLSRGLGYYGELLISAVFTAVAQLTIGKRNPEKI